MLLNGRCCLFGATPSRKSVAVIYACKLQKKSAKLPAEIRKVLKTITLNSNVLT